MAIPRIYVRDANDKAIATLNAGDYYSDTLTRYLAGKASVLELTILKRDGDYTMMTTGKKLSFRFEDDDYWLNVITVDQDEVKMTITAVSLNLEFNNEKIAGYSGKEMTFAQYFDVMLNTDKSMTLGTNEVSDKKISYEWSGTSNTLARLFSLATVFSAEVEFESVLNNNGSLKGITVNVYKEHSDSSQGLGVDRTSETFRFGNEIKTVSKTESSDELYTAILPRGKDGLTINDVEHEVLDEHGNILYATYKTIKPGFGDPAKIYAPQSRDNFPSTVTGDTDKWIVNYPDESEYTSAEALYGYALGLLKTNSVPQTKWEISGYIDARVGDTIRIADDGYKPEIYLDARITEQSISFTNPTVNKSTFSNVVELQSKISDDLLKMVEDLKKSVRYISDTVVDYQIGGAGPIAPTGEWTIDKPIVKPGDYLWTRTTQKMSDGTSIIGYSIGYIGTNGAKGDNGLPAYVHNAWAWSADGTDRFTTVYPPSPLEDQSNAYPHYMGTYSDNSSTASTNPADYTWVRTLGEAGQDGKDGIAGKDGNGIKATAVSYQASTNGTTPPTGTWAANVPTVAKGSYLWARTIWTYTDNATETGYSVAYMGTNGNNGTDGIAGKDGVGIKTTTITYAGSTSGTTAPTSGWTSTVPTVAAGSYLWTKTVWAYTDNTSETGYSVAMMGVKGDQGIKGPKGDPGNQGIPGTPGADGRTPYTHWAYANSADGALDFTPDYKSAVGLDTLNISNWAKNIAMSNSTYKFNSNADSSFKVTGHGTGGYEVLSKSFPAEIGDKLRFTVRYTNRLAFGLFSEYGLQFVVNSEYTGSVTSTSKIVLPNAITISTEYQLEYTATTNNVWMQLNFSGIADSSQVDFDVKIEMENITNPVKYAYMGTYSDYTATDSTVPTDYKWSRILGEDGADGIAGKDGKGIKSTTVTYQASSNGTTAPIGAWSATVPNTSKGQYLWTRTVWTYTDNASETGYSVSYIAKDGNDGTNGVAGKDGVGINTTTITYAQSTSGTTAPTTGYTATVPSVPAGQFLWTKTVWTYTDNSSETGYSVAMMGVKGDKGDQGIKGTDGIAGKDGKGIKATAITYQASTNGTTAPTGTWSASVPTVAKGSYLWTRTIWTYTDNTTETGYAVAYMGTNGNNGANGVAGKDGVGIKTTTITYASSTSGTTAPTSGWVATPPTATAGQFVWTRTIWTYTDNTTETGYSVGKIGEKGATGDKGATGPAGAKGDKGDTGATGPTGPKGDQGIMGVAYLQPTKPATTQQGATWFKTVSTTDHNVTGIYSLIGTAWTQTPVTAEALAVTSLSALSANLGKVTAGELDGVLIIGAEFSNPYDFTDAEQNHLQGTLTIKDSEITNIGTVNKGSATDEHNFIVTDAPLYKSAQIFKGLNQEKWEKAYNLSVDGLSLQNKELSQYGTVNLGFQDLITVQPAILTAASNWAVYSANGDANTPLAARQGRVVQLSGAFLNTATVAENTQSTMGTLPAWARPAKTINFLANGSGVTIFLCTVKSTGEITMSRYRNGRSAAYASAGSWFNIACTYAAGDIPV